MSRRHPWPILKRCTAGFIASWLVVGPGALIAQEPAFTVTPRLTASTTFTDNVDLAPQGEEISDLILRVAPGISAQAEGNRVTGQADYTLSNRTYLRDDERNEASHLFNVNGNAELLEEFFFLDASAQRREQAFSLVDPAGLGGGVGDNEAAEVTTWSLSPYLTQRLGRFANVTARYDHNRTLYERDAARDQYTNTYDVAMDSGSLFGRFFWSANYNRREIEYQEEAAQAGLANDVQLETISGTAGWELTRHLRVFGTAGEERNEFSSGLAERGGSFWSAGFTWAPTRNTSLEATTGERFYGDTYSLELQHRRRRTEWEASYSEQIATNEMQALDFSGITGQQLIRILQGDQETLDNFLVTQEQVSVFKRAQTSVTLDLRRSRWTLMAFRTEREFLQTVADTGSSDEVRTGVQGSLAWDLGPALSWNTTLRYARSRFEDDRRQTLYSGSTGLNRELGQNVDGSLTYRHQRRTTDEGAGGEFRENAITATVNMTF